MYRARKGLLAVAVATLVAAPLAAQDAASLRIARADSLARAGRHRDAIALYDSVLAADTARRDARLGRARALGWAGDYDAAERAFAAEVAVDSSAEALAGLARVAAWRGNWALGEARWRTLVAREPRSVEGWTGLGQVLRWQGRLPEAQEAIERALALAPGDADATEQLAWVRRQRRPSLDARLAPGGDSDDNRALHGLVQVMAPVARQWRAGGAFSDRYASLGTLDANGAQLVARGEWTAPGGRVSVRADAGAQWQRATRPGLPDSSRTAPTMGATLIVRPSPWLSGGIGAGYRPLDDLAATIERGLRLATLEGEATARTRGGWRASVEGLAGWISRGSAPNRTWRLGAAAGRDVGRRWDVGARARTQAFDTTLADGYFSPERFTVAEATVRLRPQPDRVVSLEGEAGLGWQWLDVGGARTDDPVQRVSATLTWQPKPGQRWFVGGTFSNVAALGTTAGNAGSYRALSFTAGMAVGL